MADRIPLVISDNKLREISASDNLKVSGVVPVTGSTYDLGSSAARFSKLYVDSQGIYTGGLYLKDSNGTLAAFNLDGSAASIAGGVSGLTWTAADNELSAASADGSSTTVVIDEMLDLDITNDLIVGGDIKTGTVWIKDDGSNTIKFTQSDGTTAATISSDNIDATTIANGTSNVAVAASSDVTIDAAGSTIVTVASSRVTLDQNTTVNGTLDVTGNLTVNGTTTTVNSTNSLVADPLIELNTGATSNANDLGFIFERGSTGDNAVFAWDESVDKFVVGTTTATGASTGDLTIASGTLVAATFEGALTGDVTGNADTATALETARNIGGVSFDGTAAINLPGVNTAGNQDTSGNAATATALATARAIALSGDVTGTANFDGSAGITIAATIAANSVALGTDTTGNYVESLVGGNGITAGAAAEGGTPSIAVDLTDNSIFATDGTVSRAVVLDASGDFSANMITSDLTGDVTGNADTATALATARAIEVSGAVTGTANFDGTAAINIVTTATADPTLTLAGDLSGSATFTNLGNATLTATIAANSVALGTDTTGNYVNAASGGNGITVTHTPAEGSSIGVAVDLTDTAIFASDGTASRAVVLDASGDFTATTATFTNMDGILGANTAAAATVTTLDVSLLASLDGGIDVDGAFTVANTSGNIATTGTLDVTGDVDINSNFTIAGATGNTVIAGTLDVTGAVVLDGDLQVNGTTTTVNAENLSVSDNMIYMNGAESAGSPTQSIDIGWAGNYNEGGTYAHAGFFRDATDQIFKAYDGYTLEPDAASQINTGHGSFALADIQAATFIGDLTGNANTASAWVNSRNITLSGDITGSTTGVNGSGNITITNMAIGAGTVGSTELASASTLLIKNSAGTTVKTIIGAGA